MADDHKAAAQQWKEFLESTPAYVEQKFENLIRDLTPGGPGYAWGFFRHASSFIAKWTMVSVGLIRVLRK